MMRDIETIEAEIQQTKLAHSDAARETLKWDARKQQALQQLEQAKATVEQASRAWIISDNKEGLALMRLSELEKELAEANEVAKAAEESKPE